MLNNVFMNVVYLHILISAEFDGYNVQQVTHKQKRSKV